MPVTLWNDYICPWAYAARPHTRWLESNGVDVLVRSFELHPDLPPEGRAVRPGGRLDQVFDHIASQCARFDLEFNKPTRSPNTHRLLAITELTQRYRPDVFRRVDEGFARAHWVDGRAIDDAEVVRAVLDDAGAPTSELLEREAEGEGTRLLEISMAEALDVEVTATPAWRVGTLTITGLHSLSQFQRWTGRILGIDGSRRPADPERDQR